MSSSEDSIARCGCIAALFCVLLVVLLNFGVVLWNRRQIDHASQAVRNSDCEIALAHFRSVIRSRWLYDPNAKRVNYDREACEHIETARIQTEQGLQARALMTYATLLGRYGTTHKTLAQIARTQSIALASSMPISDLVETKTCDSFDDLREKLLLPNDTNYGVRFLTLCAQLERDQEKDLGAALAFYHQALRLDPEGQEVPIQTEMCNAEIALAREHLDSERFLEAYDQAKSSLGRCKDDHVRTEVERVMTEALNNAAADPGSEGSQLMTLIWTEACAHVSSLAPLLDRTGTDLSRLWYEGQLLRIPQEIVATLPLEFRYAVCIELRDELVEECQYHGAVTWGRIRHDQYVEVVDVNTGEPLAQRNFLGGVPSACPESVRTRLGSVGRAGTSVALPPDDEEITQWLVDVTTVNRR